MKGPNPKNFPLSHRLWNFDFYLISTQPEFPIRSVGGIWCSLEQNILIRLITASNFAFSEVHRVMTDITPPKFSRRYIRSPCLCWSKWSDCSSCSSCLTSRFGHALLVPTWRNLPFLLHCLAFQNLFLAVMFMNTCFVCEKIRKWKKAQQPHQFQRTCVCGNIKHRTWAVSLSVQLKDYVHQW